MNSGTMSAEMMNAAPEDPRMSAESQWQLACCRPGTTHTPYVIDEKVRQDLPTGVGKTDLLANHSGQFYVLFMWFPHIGTIGGGSGYYSVIGNGGDLVNFADVIGGQVNSAAVYGDVAGFTDKFYVFNGSLDIVLRAPEATRSGSVWIGSISWSQLQAGARSFNQLRQRAKEFDLKDSARFSLKATVSDREIVDYLNRGAGTADGVNAPIWNELVAYAIISPQAFRNITNGDPVAYNADINVRVNYAWVPEFTAPMLTGTGVGNRTNHPPPTEYEKALTDELDLIIPHYPMIVPESEYNVIKAALHTALRGQKYNLDPLQSMANFYAQDYRSRIHVQDTGMRLYAPKPLPHQITPAILNLASFLKWEPGREAGIVDLDSMPPDILEKYDEFDALRSEVVIMIEGLNKTEIDISLKIRSLENRQTQRHGETIVQYRYDDDWRSYDYVFSRLLALESSEDTTSYVTVQPSQSRSNSRKNQLAPAKKTT